MPTVLPRYPVYVPSKGRWDVCLTPRLLTRDGVPFRLVVEPQEAAAYRARFPAAEILILPFSNPGSVIPARNWIKDHATAEGHARHWQLDDNLQYVKRLYKGRRIPCKSGIGLRAVEDFVDRYVNVAVAGMNYEMFVVPGQPYPPFQLNVHVYSCCLILNTLPYRWRGRYNEDTDYCLQALAGGWCTVLFNAFFVWKQQTMHMKGGNTGELYGGDGRLRMARALERAWPGVVTTRRRFQRPQHVIKNQWQRFDTPLIRRPDAEIPAGVNEYGMTLTRRREIRSPLVRELLESYRPAEPPADE